VTSLISLFFIPSRDTQTRLASSHNSEEKPDSFLINHGKMSSDFQSPTFDQVREERETDIIDKSSDAGQAQIHSKTQQSIYESS
jgi:hypothetical protein